MKVVIIDDEPLISDKLKRIMETGLRGMHTVCAFTDAQTALDYIEQEKPGVILTDIRMPGITGIGLAKQINQMDYGAKIVFLTGYAEFEYARYGIEYKVFDYLLKPVDEREAIKCISCRTKIYGNVSDFPRLFCQKSGADQTTVCGKTLFSTCNFFRKTDGTAKAEAADCNKWI